MNVVQEYIQHLTGLGISSRLASHMARRADDLTERYVNATNAVYSFTFWETTPEGTYFWYNAAKKLR